MLRAALHRLAGGLKSTAAAVHDDFSTWQIIPIAKFYVNDNLDSCVLITECG